MIRSFKVGGLRFIQIGQLSVSVCVTNKRPPIMAYINHEIDTKDYPWMTTWALALGLIGCFFI